MRSRTASRRSREGGFALLIALLAIVCLTALATGGWMLSNSERQVSHNHGASQTAFYAADAGLKQYLGDHQGSSPASPVGYTFARGEATVTAQEITEIGPYHSIWKITSDGSYDVPGGGTATRTVSRIAMLNAETFKFPGAFTSPTGLTKNGAAGSISGTDQATSTDCPAGGLEDVAGAAVPSEMGTEAYEQQGGGSVLEGDPPLLDTKTQQELLEETDIPWQEVVDGQAMQFDYEIPPDSWPDFSSMSSSENPIIYVDGDFNLPSSGQGTLVVRGDLTMGGTMNWEGPLLVGGAVTSDGKQNVYGGVISGLNLLLGETVAKSSVGNGSKVFQYDSCVLLDAMKESATFAEEPGTWYETI